MGFHGEGVQGCVGCSRGLDSLVLASVEVTRDPAARIESHLQLEQLARGVATGLQEGQVLAGERIVKMLALGHEAPYPAVPG